MPSHSNLSAIETHYADKGFVNRVLSAIAAAGIDIDRLSSDDLSTFDEFHSRGRLATAEIASQLNLSDKMHVLDVGCGIGGPSRFLATNFKCRVTGIDLTAEYCELARILAEKLGLSKLLEYHHGSATELPFENGSFDVVWTQHVAMNIKDKTSLYSEIFRVLKPGGALAIHDILAGKNQPIHFPVPWADRQDISFLATSDELKSYLNKSGMEIVKWSDKFAITLDWIKATLEKIKKGELPKLSIEIFLGNSLLPMLDNVHRNLIENRITVFEIIATRKK
jgi:ubiquinone/menaquinone biosynthesis C-methylase UbiE